MFNYNDHQFRIKAYITPKLINNLTKPSPLSGLVNKGSYIMLVVDSGNKLEDISQILNHFFILLNFPLLFGMRAKEIKKISILTTL